MIGDKNLLMDAPLSPSHLKHIMFADKGKSQVLGLGKVAISKDKHMDKVMLVESLGYNLMSVSMLCDLDMVVVFGRYRCVVIMEADYSKVFEGFRRGDLYIVDFSTTSRVSTCKSFRRLAMASTTWSRRHEEFAHTCEEEARHRHRGHQVQERSLMRCL